MKAVFLLVFLVSSVFGSSDALAGNRVRIFVGNGGEGVRTEKGIVLRDLYEGGVHNAPYVGSSALDPSLLAVTIDSTLVKEGLSLDILDKKLHDAEMLRPGFGRFLLESIVAHNWVFLDEPLGLLPEREALIQIPDSQRVQLANRHIGFVRIHRASFKQLDAINKVALILHEAVYSLVTPALDREGLKFQSLSITRDILTLLFSTPSYNNRLVGEHLIVLLNIPLEAETCLRTPAMVTSDFLSRNAPKVSASLTLGTRAEVYDATEKLCRASAKYGIMVTRVSRSPVVSSWESYESTYGPQMALKMTARPTTLEITLKFTHIDICRGTVHPLITNWIADSDFMKRFAVGVPACGFIHMDQEDLTR